MYVDKMKKNMRLAFLVFFILLTLLTANFVKLCVIDSPSFVSNPYNRRMSVTDENVRRGTITDANGNVLAYSKKGDEEYMRYYPYKNALSHVIGYSAFGKSGVESKFNYKLQKMEFEIWQRLKNLAVGSEIEADNVVLTADADFSAYITERLGGRKGAVVVLEPSTGKVLSMISGYGFNPETVKDNWKELNTSQESPLLNRATQGSYIPGSTFKIITTAAAVENMQGWENFTYDCKGEEYFDGSKLVCYNSKAHGKVDFERAFALSCNTFFASVARRIPPEKMRETASKFFIDGSLDFELDYTRGAFDFPDDVSISQTIETAIGQGKTLATPLNMAVTAAAVANGGLIMKPYIVDRIETPSGRIVEKFYPKALGQAIEPSTAETIAEMMIECVNSGTGTPAALNIQVAGKTGTAQNPAGDDHSWFVGFAPADEPEIAFAILLENIGGGGKSLQLGKEILNYYFNK